MPQNVLLELDGKLAGRLFDFSGGAIRAEVVEVSTGKTSEVRKHLSNVRVSDIVMACGPGMSKTFYDWIGGTLNHKHLPKNGALTVLDTHQKASAVREFSDAIISSVVFPALDADDKRAAMITVSISPESTRYRKATETPSLGVYATNTAKAWQANNFSLQIDGLESDCRHVTKVESIAIGVTLTKDVVGTTRQIQNIPGQVEFPNITFYVPELHADGFRGWMEDFVIKGNSRAGGERNGSLKFLTSSTKEYFELTLFGLGIFELAESGSRVKSAEPIKVGMYCQSMAFKAGGTSIK